MTYTADQIKDSLDQKIVAMSGEEPPFDSITRDSLLESHADIKERCHRGGLLDAASLGTTVPWLWRLTFGTRGLVRVGPGGPVQTVERHVIALRFLPDYLKRADCFEMLNLVEPHYPPAFHANICPLTGATCVQIYPNETISEIAESLHNLIRWRLRQLDERDALNPVACAWGRENVDRPVDDRPLFGRRLNIQLEPLEDI